MAQNPIGTVTDEQRLVPLLTREGDFLVDVTEPVRTADLPESGTYAWRSLRSRTPTTPATSPPESCRGPTTR